MATWWGDGWVTSFNPNTGLQTAQTLLSSDGVVDSNAITRAGVVPLQRPGGGSSDTGGSRTVFSAQAKIRIPFSDWQPNAWDIGGFVYVALDTFGGVKPTVDRIILNASYAAEAYSGGRVSSNPPTSGSYRDFTWNFNGPPTSLFGSNVKLWVAILPMRIDLPAGPVINPRRLPSGGSTDARAVSVWMNRVPVAPVIQSPSNNTIINSGSSFTLAFTSDDPDDFFGSSPFYNKDRCGVQVQFRPSPSAALPDPAWTDLPFTDAAGVSRPGWYIAESTESHTSGAKTLHDSGTVSVKGGTNTPPTMAGWIPAGSHQIRMRTFDYGFAFPAFAFSVNPWVRTPNNFPALNTSPWSTPVNVSVATQVPPPIPILPTNNSAVVESDYINFAWQYQNTATPPYPQQYVWFRLKKTSESVWHDLLVAHNSSVTGVTFLAPSISPPLVSGNQYEWQVKVQDSNGVTSDWSQSARFWMVPTPGGDGGGVPSETIEGATLGCGTHRAMIFRRGGKIRVGEIRNLSSVEWNRQRDDVSTAKVTVSNWDIDCGNLLASLEPWAYELVLFRDNGFGSERVWEGPITLLTYKSDEVVIHAKDVMAYAYRRIIKQKMTDAGKDPAVTVVARATQILQNVFGEDDPNLLQHLKPLSRSSDAVQYRTTPAYSRTAFEEIDDMASNAGLDYVAVGRSIILWGTKSRIGLLPEFRDEDFGSAPIVSVYGMSFANRYVISDGNGLWGEATRLDANGQDPIYGLVEMLSSSWASESDDAGAAYTYSAAAAEKVRQSFAESAERSISSRTPPPVVVRVPDNTTLNPDAVISIQHLVPGVAIPLRSVGTLKTIVATQKLDSVKVIETGGAETISVTMSPFSREDNSTEVVEE